MLSPLLTSLSIWDPFISIGSTILQPLYWVVSGILVLFHSVWSPLFGADNGWTWALSIVSLTVVIRVALIPLFVKQIKSSRSMQLLQPKVRELQKKYGHDREKLGAETMKLYKENNANPLASCLPLLIQMPIFLALFRVLDGAARNIPRGHWLKPDVSPGLVDSLNSSTILGARISDTFTKVGFANGITSVHVLTLGLILAMTATLFVTQLQLMRKNMPAEALEGPFAQQQKIMLYVFPLIFAIGGINFPVGVLIYWFTSNLWTMGQQFYVIRRNPAPGTPAFAAWEERHQRHQSHRQATEPATEVARGGVAVAESNGAAAAAPAPPRVVRQQPRKSSRSQRQR
ncbi:YidC/Oxa1 family membrane protein insertase [Microlunatus sagamiharensis]|uniref:Membrane protein insertase YidC n=1 Tax=Microlunatus sagamiharensis TaxID=546874 RepID=A0A1H2N6G2_9ACTN|nr:membrane protein insertase YidC [Microlunatus sagamiharensis]SDV01089.1 YidC/Oxa1 family membrane protein insertase [Microlunatus sagamiharensis]